MIYSALYFSPIGEITLAATDDKLIGLWFAGQKYFGGSITVPMHLFNDNAVLNAAAKWLDRYFDGQQPAISELSIAPNGTPFRQAVWDALIQIPYGRVTTYAAIAKQVAEKMGKTSMSAQAVGGAIGHNPISIIIPCHRVVGSDGNLTGYAGGIDTKIKLLKLEGIDLTKPNTFR